MNNKAELYKLTMTYGLYLGLAISLIALIFHSFGYVELPNSNSGIVSTTVIIFSMLYFGRKYQQTYFASSQITYGQAFKFIALLIVFSSIIYTFFLYIYYNTLAPNAIDLYLEQIQQAFLELTEYDEEKTKSLMELYENSMSAGVLAFSMGFQHIISGLFIDLIISFFIKSPLNLRSK